MAEIHVQPKKNTSSPTWIWILLVLLLAAAAVIYFLTRESKTDADNRANPNTTTYIPYSAPVLGNDTFVIAA